MVVGAVSSVVTFLFGTVIGVIGTLLVVYCAYCKSRRGKLDLTPAAPLYEDVSRPAPPGLLYENVGAPPPATAADPLQLELKENVAYGQVETSEDVGALPPATVAASYEDVLVPQLELKENIAYGQVETR